MPPSNLLEWRQFVEWAFLGVISGGSIWAAAYLGQISKSMKTLHEKVVVLVERTAWIDRTVAQHGGRIDFLEKKKR